nr:unnamed protein product [Digitaria exilis]
MLPAAANLTYEARCANVFKIIRFTAAMAKPGLAGARVCAVGGHDWLIELHLKVSNPNLFVGGAGAGADWIMLRVHLSSQGSPHGVAARISWRLIDPGSPPSPEKTATSSMFYENCPQDVFLVTRSELELSRRRRPGDGDCVLLQCNLTVVLDPKDVTVTAAAMAKPKLSVTVPSPDLHRQLGELLRSEKGADVTFLVAGECIPAHRSVLAARSPVFMAELLGDMKEKAPAARVVVDDMEPEVFRTLLRFVYTDTVPELEEEEGEEVTLMAQHLLEAADRYGMERLKKICVEKVSNGISLDTVATTLALAEQHGCSQLKSRCMGFILATPENYRGVAETEGYKHLEASCPSVVAELLELKVKKAFIDKLRRHHSTMYQ